LIIKICIVEINPVLMNGLWELRQ